MKKIYLLLTFLSLSIFCFAQDRNCGIDMAARLISIEYQSTPNEMEYCPCYLLGFNRYDEQTVAGVYLDQSSFTDFDVALESLREGSNYIITIGLVYDGYSIGDYSEGVINIREFTREDESTWGNSWWE